MKSFILDSTYKDAIMINSNDDISILPTHNVPSNAIAHHSLNLDKTTSSSVSHHNKNDKFNIYGIIDCL